MWKHIHRSFRIQYSYRAFRGIKARAGAVMWGFGGGRLTPCGIFYAPCSICLLNADVFPTIDHQLHTCNLMLLIGEKREVSGALIGGPSIGWFISITHCPLEVYNDQIHQPNFNFMVIILSDQRCVNGVFRKAVGEILPSGGPVEFFFNKEFAALQRNKFSFLIL